MTTIAQCLQQADALKAICDAPQRELQVLLSHCTGWSLAELYTWPDKQLSAEQLEQFDTLLQRRAKGEPMAYLSGYKDFWSLSLAVEQGVLIPRPETEILVEQCLLCVQSSSGSLLDLGTGTGAIALAFASEKPTWNITAVDANPQAVRLATHNAKVLKLENVSVHHSDWLSALKGQMFDVIVANPPYIDSRAPELNGDGVKYEPRSALVAADAGMSDLKHIIEAAKPHLNSQAYLLLEHGYDQGELCRAALLEAGYTGVKTIRDYADHERVTLAQYVY